MSEYFVTKPHIRMNGRYTPPAIAPTLVLEPPELLPPPPEEPLEVEEGTEDVPVPGTVLSVGETVFGGETVEEEEVVLEMETTGGAVGVASGSLPAAFASVTSNEPVCTKFVRDMNDPLVEYTYGPIRICPMWD